MKAAILYGKEKIKIEELTPRSLEPGEVRIDIQAALTCGTDLKVFKRGYHAKMIAPPAVFGHELAGVISEVGAPLTPSLSPSDGERVAAQPGERLSVGPGEWHVGDRVAVAKHLGCTVSLAGRGDNRLKKARQLGAATVIDAANPSDLAEAVLKESKASFDVVIEAVGKPETWEAAVQWVRKGGAVNFFGGCPSGSTVSLDTARIHYSGLTLLASFHHTPRTIRRALELIESGIIKADDFVDGECPLSELPELFQSMAAGNRAVKTLVRVHE